MFWCCLVWRVVCGMACSGVVWRALLVTGCTAGDGVHCVTRDERDLYTFSACRNIKLQFRCFVQPSVQCSLSGIYLRY